jgi:8-oxo-dGTP diphosphatase
MKTLVRTTENISWLANPNQARLYITDELPAKELWGTAFGFVFNQDKILLIRLKKRGWDIPGGKIDAGETPAQAVVREVREEANARVQVVELIGIQELELLGPRPEGHRWPYLINTQIFFKCRLETLEPFHKNTESSERGFFSPHEAMLVPTMVNHVELYEEALRRVGR